MARLKIWNLVTSSWEYVSGFSPTALAADSAFTSKYAPISLGRVGSILVSGDQTGIVASQIDMTGYSITFTAIAGRLYHMHYAFCAQQNTTGGANQVFYMSDSVAGVTTIHNRLPVAVGAEMISGFWPIGNLAAGVHTVKLRAYTSVGTMSILNTGFVNGRFAIYDVGV